MDDLKTQIAAFCRVLFLSYNPFEIAMTTRGDKNQVYLYHLLKDDLTYRKEKRIANYMNVAGFPMLYSRNQFHTDEIDFPDGVSFDSLLNLDFLYDGKNVLMYGGTVTGKTMLSILIGMEAFRQGIPVKFYRTSGIISLLTEGLRIDTLSELKNMLNTAQILILYGFGYISYDRTGVQLLFDYLSEIHKKKPVILNPNLEFSQWFNVLYYQSIPTPPL